MATEVEAQLGAVTWYARAELPSPWRIAACPEHGRILEHYRFEWVGVVVLSSAGLLRTAEICAVCRSPALLREVERCTCEHDTARCPAHQNLGCGC